MLIMGMQAQYIAVLHGITGLKVYTVQNSDQRNRNSRTSRCPKKLPSYELATYCFCTACSKMLMKWTQLWNFQVKQHHGIAKVFVLFHDFVCWYFMWLQLSVCYHLCFEQTCGPVYSTRFFFLRPKTPNWNEGSGVRFWQPVFHLMIIIKNDLQLGWLPYGLVVFAVGVQEEVKGTVTQACMPFMHIHLWNMVVCVT